MTNNVRITHKKRKGICTGLLVFRCVGARFGLCSLAIIMLDLVTCHSQHLLYTYALTSIPEKPHGLLLLPCTDAPIIQAHISYIVPVFVIHLWQLTPYISSGTQSIAPSCSSVLHATIRQPQSGACILKLCSTHAASVSKLCNTA